MAKLFTDADHVPSVSSFDVKSVYVCLILVFSLTYAANMWPTVFVAVFVDKSQNVHSGYALGSSTDIYLE